MFLVFRIVAHLTVPIEVLDLQKPSLRLLNLCREMSIEGEPL